MDRPTFLVLSLLILVCFLELLHVYLESEIGVLNYHYADILTQLDTAKYQNQLLKERVLQQEALSKIQQIAQEKGFIQAHYVYLKANSQKE